MQITAIDVLGNKREVSSDELNVSSYSSIIPFFLWKKIPDKSWIICPRYGGGGYDVQVGVTGTCWEEEPPELALSREVQEETGLVMLKEPDFLAETKKGSQKWLWAVCNTNKTASAIGIQSLKNGPDNKKCKIGALVYTNRKKSLENMIVNSAKWGGLFFLPRDRIIELLIVPTSLAKQWTLPLSKNRNGNPVDNHTKNLKFVKPNAPKFTDINRVWPRGNVIKQNHQWRTKYKKKKKSPKKRNRRPRSSPRKRSPRKRSPRKRSPRKRSPSKK